MQKRAMKKIRLIKNKQCLISIFISQSKHLSGVQDAAPKNANDCIHSSSSHNNCGQPRWDSELVCLCVCTNVFY